MATLAAQVIQEGHIFYPLALVSLVGAFATILARNPVYAAMSLVGTFFGIAGIYVVLAAHLLAALQIIVYAGAIMVLFLFVIMLLSLSDRELGEQRITTWKVIGGAAATVFAGLAYTVFERLPPASTPGTLPGGYGYIGAVGKLIYTDFVLPFEATSILLLVAVVGAVVVAKAKI